MASTVTVSSRGEQRVRSGHPLDLPRDVVDVRAEGGEIVQVLGPRNRTLGCALFSDRSQISIRMLTHGEVSADLSLLRARLESAIAFRETLGLDANAYRLVHGEADLLPSLIVDRYGDYLGRPGALAGHGSPAAPDQCDAGRDCGTGRDLGAQRPESAGARRAGPDRRGGCTAACRKRWSCARVPSNTPWIFAKDRRPVSFSINERIGRLQPDTRAGGSWDCFSYNGGFALRLARQCPEAEAIDISADAVARIRANAERNRVPHLEAREANVFDELRRLERAGARYDTIVLDPPAFAKNKASIPNALAGYKEINLRAMRLLIPGGDLVTCSCSYNVNEEGFAAMLNEASVDSHAPRRHRREAYGGPRSPRAGRGPRNALLEMFHPAETRVSQSRVNLNEPELVLWCSGAWVGFMGSPFMPTASSRPDLVPHGKPFIGHGLPGGKW